MNRAKKTSLLFLIFGLIYFLIECLWKQHLTHWSMFILGGMVGVLIGGINEVFDWDMPFYQQCLAGASIAVIAEGITGIVVNVWLGLNLWHYNVLPYFLGQCSIPFTIAWFALAGVAILIDDWLRWKLFGEQKPHYVWR